MQPTNASVPKHLGASGSRARRRTAAALTALVVGVLVASACATSRVDPAAPNATTLMRAETVYREACAPCHGLSGDGAGAHSVGLVVAPRDFRDGVFKFRSTPSGSMPTDFDLVRTIAGGLHGTSMPPFAALDRHDALALAAYVRGFAEPTIRAKLAEYIADEELEPDEAEELIQSRLRPGTPIAIAAELPVTSESVDAGRALYERMECATCHGETGEGDGPSAAEGFVDAWGNTLPAADFTIDGGIKGGDTARDIYRTFMTGINGTPMPSYAGQLSPEEAWQLAHYVLWLRR